MRVLFDFFINIARWAWVMEILFQLLLKGCTIEAISENRFGKSTELFQLLLKGCTIEAPQCLRASCPRCSFQLLLKGCTIEAFHTAPNTPGPMRFSCCWKDVRLKLCWRLERDNQKHVSVVVERMYDWSKQRSKSWQLSIRFSCCWKDVRLKLRAYQA